MCGEYSTSNVQIHLKTSHDAVQETAEVSDCYALTPLGEFGAKIQFRSRRSLTRLDLDKATEPESVTTAFDKDSQI